MNQHQWEKIDRDNKQGIGTAILAIVLYFAPFVIFAAWWALS